MNHTNFKLLAVVLVILCANPQPALSAEDDVDVGVVADQTAQEQAVAEAVEEAREREFFEGLASDTYKTVLDDPDNIGLNYKYAQQQIREGNFLGASVTLERILMIDASLDKIRLYYAVVLYRIGNLIQSQQELELLETRDLPDQVRSEVGRYLKRIRSARKTTRLSLRQSVGWEIDSNRNASAQSKRQFSLSTPVGITGTSGKRRDTGLLSISRIDIVHDLKSQSKHEFLGSFTYYRQEQAQVDSLDLESFQFDTGFKLFMGDFIFTPQFYSGVTLLSKETFLRNQGGNFRLERPFGTELKLFGASKVERQDYCAISESPDGFERKGNMTTAQAGVDLILSDNMMLSSSCEYIFKDALLEHRAYEGLKVASTHTWFIGKGQYIINSVDTEFDHYDAVDDGILSSRKRHDKAFNYRLILGVSVKDLLGEKFFPDLTEGVTASFTYGFTRTLSNITNYTYTNHKYQLMVSKRIEF